MPPGGSCGGGANLTRWHFGIGGGCCGCGCAVCCVCCVSSGGNLGAVTFARWIDNFVWYCLPTAVVAGGLGANSPILSVPTHPAHLSDLAAMGASVAGARAATGSAFAFASAAVATASGVCCFNALPRTLFAGRGSFHKAECVTWFLEISDGVQLLCLRCFSPFRPVIVTVHKWPWVGGCARPRGPEVRSDVRSAARGGPPEPEA